MKKFVVTTAYYDNNLNSKTQNNGNKQNNILSLIELLPKLNLPNLLGTTNSTQKQANTPPPNLTKYNYIKTATTLQKNREKAFNITNYSQNTKNKGA